MKLSHPPILIAFFLLSITTVIAQKVERQYILFGIENFEEVKSKLELSPTQIKTVKSILKIRDDRFHSEYLSLIDPETLESDEQRKLYKEALIRKKTEIDQEAALKLSGVLNKTQLMSYSEMMEISISSLRAMDFSKQLNPK